MSAGNPVQGAARAPPLSPRAGYRRLVTLLLMLAYTFNAADRNLISIVAQPMKAELRLTDTQLGLLAGTAFAVLYALASLPIARLAERYSRVNILALALASWSALSALCAAAGSYAQLLLIRVGVGIGEAGCSAPAQSLLSDYYDRTRRTSALSVYSCGLSLGYLFVSVVGGYVLLHHGWRAACLAVALPGAVVAVLIRRVVREPGRGQADAADGATPAHTDPAPFSLRHELAELGSCARGLFLSWPSANVIAGFTLSSFASYGAWVFIPAYFNRAFALDFASIGVFLGLAGSVPVALGTLGGGFVSDRAGRRSERWYALVPALGLAAAAPLYILAFLQHEWRNAVLLLCLGGFCQYVSLGPTFGIVQNVAGVHRRATATALLYLCLTLLALAGGAPFTGRLIDELAAAHFAYGDFHAACVEAAMRHAGCASALARASREGIIVTFSLQLWAAAHYALGAIGLGRQMQLAARGAA